jgi:hypothetical protein
MVVGPGQLDWALLLLAMECQVLIQHTDRERGREGKNERKRERMKERERGGWRGERDRQNRQRQTETEIDRETEGQRDIEETKRQRERDIETERLREEVCVGGHVCSSEEQWATPCSRNPLSSTIHPSPCPSASPQEHMRPSLIPGSGSGSGPQRVWCV